MRPNVEELKSIWLHSYSRTSLLEAKRCLSAIDTAKPGSAEHGALVCATVVAYARPFTKWQITLKERVVPLEGIPPPVRLEAAHKIVLKLRDKVVGHKDAVLSKDDGVSPNIVVFRRDTTGFDLHTIIIDDMHGQARKEVKELCSHFVAHCEEKLKSLIGPYLPEIMRFPPGLYELLVAESPNDWIRRHKNE
jgi:hypothetical protein